MSLKVSLKKSLNGANEKQKQTAYSLGLRKINQFRVFKDNPALRGKIKKISHLLSYEEVK